MPNNTQEWRSLMKANSLMHDFDNIQDVLNEPVYGR